MKTMTRIEKLQQLQANTSINLERGSWAVALVGYVGWQRESAIGDGITSACNALVTRCETREAAERLAEQLNDLQPCVMPGSPDVPKYAAFRYDITDYLSQQDQRNGNRRADRRIAAI